MTDDSRSVVEIFTDGACSGNPGPGGWGVLMRYGETEKELFGGEKATTNNRQELTAVIRALEALTRPVKVISIILLLTKKCSGEPISHFIIALYHMVVSPNMG